MQPETPQQAAPRANRFILGGGWIAPALAVAAFLGAFVATASRAPAPAVEPARVATVDLEKVFNSLKRYEGAQARIKALATELEGQAKTAETKVRGLQSDLDSFREGSKEQADAIASLQTAVGELRAVQQFIGAKIELERARAMRDTYLAVKDAVRRLAERDGYDYILLDDSVVQMDQADAAKTMAQISARRFLYANGKRDVTEQLIGMMNGE
jgi:Skp family chaperone for outer membrane proteins